MGRVVRLTGIDPETGAISDLKDLGRFPHGKVFVEVDEVFKGSADGLIEFAVHGGCYGPIAEGKTHIFNLHKTPDGYSRPQWSSAIDDLTPSERDKYLNNLRALIRGERVSTLFGS